jgi:hypothetical protein
MIYSCVASHSSIDYLYKRDPASVYGVPIIMDLTNTSSEQSLPQAQIWLQNCSKIITAVKLFGSQIQSSSENLNLSKPAVG